MASPCTHLRVCTYVHADIYTHACAHACADACAYVCACAHTCLLVCNECRPNHAYMRTAVTSRTPRAPYASLLMHDNLGWVARLLMCAAGFFVHHAEEDLGAWTGTFSSTHQSHWNPSTGPGIEPAPLAMPARIFDRGAASPPFAVTLCTFPWASTSDMHTAARMAMILSRSLIQGCIAAGLLGDSSLALKPNIVCHN